MKKHCLLIILIAGAVIIRLLFWFYTDRIWDDALIAVAYARNAAEGYGLIHHVNDGRVQGFSSVAAVAVSFVGEVIRLGMGVTAIRIASLLASALTLIFSYKISARLKMGKTAFLFWGFYLAFEYNQIFFGMAGMETQMATAILMGSIYYVAGNRLVLSGTTFALALFARPDFILWVIPAAIYLLIKNGTKAIKTVIIALTVLGPWILFAQSYYGTVIPHSIIAKKTIFLPFPPFALNDLIVNAISFWQYFIPFHVAENVTNTPLPIPLLFIILGLSFGSGLLGIWVSRKKNILYPSLLFIIFFSVYRIIFIAESYFIWYMVPVLSVATLYIALGIDYISRSFKVLAAAVALILAFFIILPVPYFFPLEKIIQAEVEDGVRKKIGEYLKNAVSPDEAVITESLGFIGYYAGAKVPIFDYPGLASPTALSTLARIPFQERDGLFSLITKLKTKWLVLRQSEYIKLKLNYPKEAILYKIDSTYFTRHNNFHNMGVRLFNTDTYFYVLKRIN